MAQTRLVFFGAGNFGRIVLERLIRLLPKEHLFIVTQPDRPVGPKKLITPNPVADFASRHNLPLKQPERLTRTFSRELAQERCQVAIVASYGLYIPASLLQLPERGFINIHPSLLPNYRGPAPISFALLDGQEQTGVTIMRVDTGMDTGPIIAQQICDIDPVITRQALESQLAIQGADLLVSVLPGILQGNERSIKQPACDPHPTHLLSKMDGLIDWSKTSRQIFDQFRALLPWPGIWTTWNGSVLKLNQIRSTTDRPDDPPGFVYGKSTQGLQVACGSGAIEIIRLTQSGRREQGAFEFLRGHPQIVGSRLN